MPQMSIAEALRAAIRDEMRRDPRVFCLGEDIGIPGGFGGAFTVTLGLSDEFGHERILDTPISEALIAGMAVGAAVCGLRPIADVQYGDFLFNMMDQLANQAAKLRYMSGGTLSVPMVMRAPVGATGRGSQHAQSLEAFFTHVPGLKIVAPATAYDPRACSPPLSVTTTRSWCSSTSSCTAPRERAPRRARSARWARYLRATTSFPLAR